MPNDELVAVIVPAGMTEGMRAVVRHVEAFREAAVSEEPDFAQAERTLATWKTRACSGCFGPWIRARTNG